MNSSLVTNCSFHVEVLQRNNSNLTEEHIKELVQDWVLRNVPGKKDFLYRDFDNEDMLKNIEHILICDIEVEHTSKPETFIHVYAFNSVAPIRSDDNVNKSTHWILPSAEFHHLWDSLIFDSNIKEELLRFVSSIMLFAEKDVNSDLVTCNRMILLHGPPGTGKTSLCKALAQKLSIRFSDSYEAAFLVEVNAQNLFSKWFSESGKNVMEMFQSIREMCEIPKSLVLVLVDEVETLAHSRYASFQNGTEPSDSIRAVNSLLTELDSIQRYPNVITLMTSNITAAIDIALFDRVDLNKYISLPSEGAIYQILYSAIAELQRAGIVSQEKLLSPNSIQHLEGNNIINKAAESNSLKLLNIAKKSKGFSGRTLRKLPLIAHSSYFQPQTISLSDFLDALLTAVEKRIDDSNHMNKF